MSLKMRRLQIVKDVLFSEAGAAAPKPITRAVALAVIANPFTGRHVQDLSPLFDTGSQIAEQVMPQLVAALSGPPVSYGKGAIVGVNGDMEHGGALCHPKMGKPVRAAVGGGEALIASNVKVGAAGATLDVPLGHKDDGWSFDHFDTITVGISDAPRPDEIVVVIAVADGGRVNPRVGKGRIL